MTEFSASDAALEGFHLIRRRWRVVLGWAGFTLLALVMIVVLSAVLSVVASAVGGGGDAARNPALGVAGVIVLCSFLFTQAILVAGVFRLEMRPEEPAFMHLRLGRDELRLLLVWLITITGAWVLGWLAAVIGHALGAGGVGLELLAAVLAIYLGLRFALAAPISFAERRIDFLRSWRLTRGRVLSLLGMSALSLCLILLVTLTVFVALVLVALGFGGLDGLSGVFGGSEALQSHPGIFLLAFVIQIVLAPVVWTLGMAPVAAAYRAFADGDGPKTEPA
ncbi:hypothetical protein LJR225_001082 [Phenylobacterium sp. LjRoot225]|uniref:hypothetical protein n=1 Tax=Phenylobacterium sp. LjRoot225 TaxID=3342285 RepID=UPI003ECF64F8